jgi:hypothetical protein
MSMSMTVGPASVAGRYLLGEVLGEGGMGRVWLARDEVLGRDVAIKELILPPELVAGERDAVQRRTLREARAAAQLNHPSVAQVYDVFTADGRTWIVMEYVPSRSLQQVIDADGPLEPRRVALIGLEVLAALDAAHRAGVRHRDVKPANVLLADDGRVVLTDFGIATIEGDSVVTSSDVVIGSPKYLSPERVRHGVVGPASDLWSLGATLYAAVEGRSPYERPSAMATLTALAADEPDPARQAGALQPVLDGLLRKDPDERIDGAEAERRLRTAAAAAIPRPRAPREQSTAPAGPATAAGAGIAPTAAPARPTGSGRRPALIAAATAVLLAGAAATWFAIRPGADDAARSTPRSTATAAGAPAGAGPAGSGPAGSGPAGSGPATSPASAVPSAGASTSASGAARPRPARPAGWIDYRDPTGFSLYVPDGWKRSKKGTIVYFRDAGSGRVLGIDQTGKPQWNPVADWRGQAAYRVRRGDFPGYREVHIVPVPYFLKAADWEFTFDRGGRQHVNNRGFVVSTTQAYGIYWQTRDADWKAARADLQLIFDSFRPAQR